MARLPDIGALKINTDDIALFDISKLELTTIGVIVHSPYYSCTVTIGASLLQHLLKWLIKENYVILDGSLTIPIMNRKDTYYG